MAKLLRLEVAQLTDVGRRRDHNEDNMAYVIPKDSAVMMHKGALLIVADGMGGHAAGEVASEIAVEIISNAYYQDESDDVPTSLMQAIRRANAAIQQRAAENMLRSGMGTTCVAAVVRGNMAYIANIGDSRAYVVRQARIRQVSQDHSWVAEQVRAGLLTEEQARNHAQRNVITRSLGTQHEVEIDIFREQLEEGDRLLLCSDGLSGMVNDEELQQTLNQFVPQESVYHLIDRANENGGIDNITAIVAHIQELGVEPPGVRQPVMAGGPELSNEDTARLIVSPGGGVSVAARSPEVPLPGSPFPAFTEEQLASAESDTAPQPVLRAKKQHGRLFLPTIVLLILFILVAGGGGGYYFIHMSQVVSSTLNNAGQLISRADGELSSNPAQALQDLATAQQQLRSLSGLNASDTARFNTLQTQLVNATRTAINNYNQGAKIVQLPCNNTTPGTLNKGAAGTPVQAFTVLKAQNGALTSYALGQDGKIYSLIGGTNLQAAFPPSTSTASTQVTAIAGSGNRIFALSTQTDASGKASYSVNLLSPAADTTLQAAQPQGIDPNLTQGGEIPGLITAWGNNVYVLLLSQTNANSATILSYTTKDTLVFAQKISVSVSDKIVSAAAFPNQLFLLLADGSVLSLQVSPTDATFASSSPSPAPVLLHTPIAPPLKANTQHFTASISVPTAAGSGQKGNSPLTVPMTAANNPALLSAGQTSDGIAHLFIGDPVNQRVLDLTVQPVASSGGPDTTPTTSPTSSAPGSSVALNLVQQYVSPGYFAMIKSVVADPGGTTLFILGQNSQNTQSLIILSVGQQPACASA